MERGGGTTKPSGSTSSLDARLLQQHFDVGDVTYSSLGVAMQVCLWFLSCFCCWIFAEVHWLVITSAELYGRSRCARRTETQAPKSNAPSSVAHTWSGSGGRGLRAEHWHNIRYVVTANSSILEEFSTIITQDSQNHLHVSRGSTIYHEPNTLGIINEKQEQKK